MAVDHYENFPVASWLCPAHIRPAVLSLYRFARHADDVADEGDANASERLRDLESMGRALTALSSGEAVDSCPPTVLDLWPHVVAHGLNVQLLHQLLSAFTQDVRMTAAQQRMPDMNHVLDYCRRSANPVGRLMLQLMRADSPENQSQSDDICTALQLINFWQDLSLDRPRGRFYLPPELSLKEAVTLTRAQMIRGAPLAWRIPGRMGWELRAVVHGGLRILERIEQTDIERIRPTLSPYDWLLMTWRCLNPQPPRL